MRGVPHCCRCRINAGLSCAHHPLEDATFCERCLATMPPVLPDLEVEQVPPGAQLLPDEQITLSGGCFFLCGSIDNPQLGKVPLLVFRFTGPDGMFLPAIALALPPTQLADFHRRLGDAIDLAIGSAS